MSGDNVYVDKNGKRSCKTCQVESKRRFRQREAPWLERAEAAGTRVCPRCNFERRALAFTSGICGGCYRGDLLGLTAPDGGPYVAAKSAAESPWCRKRLHEFTPENTIVRKKANGGSQRVCRACLRVSEQRRLERIRAAKAAA